MQNLRNKIWSAALKQIQLRMLSRFNLKQKLLQKFPESPDEIDWVLNEMETVQLLNDKRYAQELIHHLTQRAIGRIKMGIEFRKRGLDEDLIPALLMECGYNEEKMAQKALDQKLKTLKEEDPRKKKQKLSHFLQNRGFTNAVIYSTVNSK